MKYVEIDSWKDAKLTYFLGFMMIVVGAIGIESIYLTFESSSKDVTFLSSKIILIILGVSIILMPHKSNMRAIGIYAVALGVGRILRSIVEIKSPDDYVFYFGVIMFALGCSLSYCGLSYLKGVSKNTVRMILITGAIVVGYLVYFAFLLHWGNTWESILNHNRDSFLMIVMYASYVLILSSREVHNNIPIEKARASLEDIAEHVRVEDKMFITRDDVMIIKDGFSDRSLWQKGAVHGPIESEVCIKLTSDKMTRDLVIQKWDGSDGLYVSMLNDRNGSFIRGLRSKLVSIVPVGGSWGNFDTVVLNDENGMFAILGVTEAADES